MRIGKSKKITTCIELFPTRAIISSVIRIISRPSMESTQKKKEKTPSLRPFPAARKSKAKSVM